ncbi:MAG TPA: hypothetical protein EYO48_04580 [Candidatus Marinimicrobia bacterium]|nr:hypothetical protein [Candidatus Neomarinimicrobiota bacterium]
MLKISSIYPEELICRLTSTKPSSGSAQTLQHEFPHPIAPDGIITDKYSLQTLFRRFNGHQTQFKIYKRGQALCQFVQRPYSNQIQVLV